MLVSGMARLYIKTDPVTGQRTIRRPRTVAGFRGTLRYAAIGVHENRDQCRKDDVEGWFYTLIELTTGNIPWKASPQSLPNSSSSSIIHRFRTSMTTPPSPPSSNESACPTT